MIFTNFSFLSNHEFNVRKTGLGILVCFLFAFSYTSAANSSKAQPKTQALQTVFEINNPDFQKSPCSGMTRKHWKDAALYLLKGAFSYVKTMDDPMYFPKQEGKTYPRDESQVPTAKLEGLCRTLFIAAPLLKDDPNLEINGLNVAEYYRHQLVRLLDPNSPTYIKPRTSAMGPHQNLVEFGGLSVALFAIPEILWNPLTQQQKDGLEALMVSYGDGPTFPNNWKFFNIFVLSFYKSQGYQVNENLIKDYLEKTLAHYSGDGWYKDNTAYDYYSMWAFQMYGMIWSDYFGKKYYPQYAARFAENFRPMKSNYPYMFSRKGEMIMWGRSISYRFGATAPFPFMGLENDSSTNYGWMRRISSGALLQFLQNPGYLKGNVPTLGFYGEFEPAVQSYSCRGSVYWCGKAFLGLLLPESNPYWSATENEGAWETKELAKGTVFNKFENGSNILLTDYPNIGASEIRSCCSLRVGKQHLGAETYNRLAYNSAFPWQADGDSGEVSMNYLIKTSENKWEPLQLYTFKKNKDGIYYRDAVIESNSNVKLRLADIPLANGILRVDRNITAQDLQLRLGHYALPQLKDAIREENRKVNGYDVKIIDNGVYQLAMVNVQGWKGMEVVRCDGLNPVAEKSAVINVFDHFVPGPNKSGMYVTLMLWKKSGEKWTTVDLMPIKKIKPLAGDSGLTIYFKDGVIKTVIFE